MYGWHTVTAALQNPARHPRKLLATENAARRLTDEGVKSAIEPEIVRPSAIAERLLPDAVHQGLALLADPLPELEIEDALAGTSGHRRLIVLDQVSDPHNLGAILRSAAAFGACGVIVQERHSPPQSGVLAKAASGALETVPLIRVVNIARALDELGDLAFWRLAFADEAAAPLNTLDLARDLVLVLGAGDVTRAAPELLTRLGRADVNERGGQR